MQKKILIIEDYPATSRMVAEILEMEGFATVAAFDGKTGIEKAIQENPDLILLDIMLPGMDGLEVCDHLQADPQTKNIPIIFVTVKASAEDVKIGLGKGASGYISKPFDPFKLIEVVKEKVR